jgi:hypothetical protein
VAKYTEPLHSWTRGEHGLGSKPSGLKYLCAHLQGRQYLNFRRDVFRYLGGTSESANDGAEDAGNMGIILGDKAGVLHRRTRRESQRSAPESGISWRRERQS